jgi:hypothetical protein
VVVIAVGIYQGLVNELRGPRNSCSQRVTQVADRPRKIWHTDILCGENRIRGRDFFQGAPAASVPTHPSDKNKAVRWMGHSFVPHGPALRADPPVGQKQRRPMDGAQFHSPWAGFAGGGLKSGLRPVINWITSTTNAITSKM